MGIEYSESIEEATQIARAALPLASQLAVPANPVNYAVFYEYVAGQNPQLTAALDQLRETVKDLSNAELRALYHNFVSETDEESLKEVRRALSTIIDSTRGSLEKVGNESQIYQENLGVAAKQLGGAGGGDVVDVVTQLIDETVRMQKASRELQEELAQTNQDLSKLRSEFKRVREESLVDPLTGVQNRRAFDASLETAFNQAQQSSEPLCLLMVDIDHFKKVNDTYGHVVGDAVLKLVARAINDTVRGGDVLARYGGEEFILLLPDTPLEGAERVADNICNVVRNQIMDRSHVGKDIGRVTVSVGVALFCQKESAEAFVARADTALYRAKQSGRNRVCTDEVR
ncbi:MAG TPA: diguanylate cyclase [Gammaproteobacteria bacterium]|nr:diguanylate cyclase [Gammaproteobacteria bacterium]